MSEILTVFGNSPSSKSTISISAFKNSSTNLPCKSDIYGLRSKKQHGFCPNTLKYSVKRLVGSPEKLNYYILGSIYNQLILYTNFRGHNSNNF